MNLQITLTFCLCQLYRHIHECEVLEDFLFFQTLDKRTTGNGIFILINIFF